MMTTSISHDVATTEAAPMALSQRSTALWMIFAQISAEGETYAQDEHTTEVELATYFCGRGGEQWMARARKAGRGAPRRA
jgi:hypothetical protein